MGIQLQHIHLADGRDAINSYGVGSDWVELCLKGLQVFSSEMPLQHLKALGVSKASRQVAGIAKGHQVIAAMPLVVIEDHRRFPVWIVQEDPGARRPKALRQFNRRVLAHQPEGLASLEKLPVLMAHGFVGQRGNRATRHSDEQVRQLQAVAHPEAQPQDGAADPPEHLFFFDALLFAHHDALQHLPCLEAVAATSNVQHLSGVGNPGVRALMALLGSWDQ